MQNNLHDIKKNLDTAFIAKIKNLEIRARKVVEGFMVGLHKSPYHGFSAEFSQHRPYMQGDPLKGIDWKVFAKSERYYIKQYEEETNLIANIFLDSSRSMNFKHSSQFSKLEYATTLAAALSYILINQQDSVGLTVYSDKIESYNPPKSTKVYLKTLLGTLSNIKSSGKTETAKCLYSSAELIKKRGLTIILSDFFDDPQSIVSALKHFHFRKNEVIVFQILDKVELSFGFENDSIFVDAETNEEITTQPNQIKRAYQEAMSEHISKIKNECLGLGIEYSLVTTEEPFDKALMSYFSKRSKLN